MSGLGTPPAAMGPPLKMSRLQKHMVAQIDSGASYNQLYATVVRMAEEITRKCGSGGQRVMNTIRNERESVKVLLHTIPRPFLRAIVSRTVAFELSLGKDLKPDMIYSPVGPGAYVGTICIANRGGRGWTAEEGVQLARLAEQYAIAAEALEGQEGDWAGTQLTEVQSNAMHTAERIDRARDEDEDAGYESASTDVTQSTVMWRPPTTLRFANAEGKQKARAARLLSSMLTKQQSEVFGTHRKTPSMQSLSMVGNAGDILQRFQSHRLTSNLANSPKIWGLLIHCLAHIGLQPEVVLLPVCKAWETKHINHAEVLVTLLAGSLIEVSGLNIKLPGTRNDNASAAALADCRSEVLGAKPWYLQNLRRSLVAHRLTLSPLETMREKILGQKRKALSLISEEEAAQSAIRKARDEVERDILRADVMNPVVNQEVVDLEVVDLDESDPEESDQDVEMTGT
ncbi:hypothetical protein F4805DRAFT_121641 [Annulohypoxylon moriforme]|nr:hypothetical protein F4805DRAFT_121641 [Annulohypoxylon moriforme]